MKAYNLDTMAGMANYDEMVERYADDCLNSLDKDELLGLNADDYALSVWDLDQNAGSAAETNDVEEARSRFLSTFANAIVLRQRELSDHYDLRFPGHGSEVHTARVVSGVTVEGWRWLPGGQFTRNSNVDLPHLIGKTIAELHEMGFRKRADEA